MARSWPKGFIVPAPERRNSFSQLFRCQRIWFEKLPARATHERWRSDTALRERNSDAPCRVHGVHVWGARSSAIQRDLVRSYAVHETFLLDQESSAVLYNCILPVTRNLRGPMTWRDADDGCAARGHRGHGPEDSRGCGPGHIRTRQPVARRAKTREQSAGDSTRREDGLPALRPRRPTPPARTVCMLSPLPRAARSAHSGRSSRP